MIQQVTSFLSDGKRILRLSLGCLMESMRRDPQKYNKSIYCNGSLSSGGIDQYSIDIYGRQLYPSYDNLFEKYNPTLLEEAEKLYNKSVKELTEQIITEYSIKNSLSQLFRPGRKQRQQFRYMPFNKLSLPIAISDNQAIHIRGVEHIFR